MTDATIKPNGALIDSRPHEKRIKDYKAEEVLTASAVSVFDNKQVKQLTATEYNQWYTSSCVFHAFYTQLEYEGILPAPMSQLRGYRKRVNYPQEGSIAVDAYDKIKSGQSPLADAPVVPYHTEKMANDMKYVLGNKIVPDFNYFSITDYTQVPREVASGKAVTIFIYATQEEWSREFVDIIEDDMGILDSKAEVRHAVCLIPKGDFTKNKKQWLSVHDSAKFGGRHLRYITYEFLLKRAYYASKVVKAGELPPVQLPPVVGKPIIPCQFEDNNGNVRSLQAYLAEHGYLEPQYVTGYYGRITAKAVLWFQLFHHEKFSVKIPQLLEWEGKYWGKESIKIVTSTGV